MEASLHTRSDRTAMPPPVGCARAADSREGVWTYELATGEFYGSDPLYRLHGVAPGTPMASDDDRLAPCHRDDRDRVRRILREVGHGGGPATFAYRVVLPSGDVRLVDASVALIRDRDGKPMRLCGAVRDVTDQLKLHEALAHAQRQSTVGVLASGVAHDFGNLLCALGLNATRLRRELTAAHDRAASALDEIDASLRRARELTRNLLTYASRRVPEPRTIAIGEAVAGLGGLLRRLAGIAVDVAIDVEPDLPMVEIDPTELEQVIINLIVNARDAMPGGGNIHVMVRAADDAVVIDVADDGLGMDEATRARIFEPFFTTKGPGEGHGLGLATSRTIIERAGGRIDVDSWPGAGSVFRIRLPFRD